MQIARFVVNHATAHRDCVLQHFISKTELLERVNPARRKREIDRASADEISFARIGASFVKIDLVSASSQIRGEQSSGKSAADENEFLTHGANEALMHISETVSQQKGRNVECAEYHNVQ